MRFRTRWARVLVALSLAGGLVTAPAAAKKPKVAPLGLRITFSAVDWLTPADSIEAQLAARGYRASDAPGEGANLVAAGPLFDHPAIVRGWLDEHDRLLRWVVTVAADEKVDGYPAMRRIYDDILAESETKYGPRESWTERFVFPYEKGDHKEADALREGKATVRSVWVDRDGDRLSVEMSRHGDVVLTYQCPGWDALQERIRRKKARDL